MENPPHSPLGGLDPANLLKQGAAEDTFMDGAATSFNPPPIVELAGIFPQFEILELIGQGGMGAVYKVRQKDLDRIVALKILPPAIGQSPEFAARFTREAKALGKLNHPGIVTLHEFGQQDGLYFILMEFVDGVNLAQLMKSGRISPREALAIVPQICEALQFAHDQGIVHRDIKPENLLLDRLGRVKIADFGIAKVVAAVCDHPAEEEGNPRRSQIDATLGGKILGTPQYMAPEQISHPAEVDHRADIYALGVVFYQMLTGELPGKCLEAPSKKVHIDVRLDEIVLKAMEKAPEMRYQTAHEFRTMVDGVQAPVHALPPSLPLAPPKRSMLRRWWWVLLVISILTLIPSIVGTAVFFRYQVAKSQEKIGIEADNNAGAEALLKAQDEAPVQIPLKTNHQQVFTSYSPDRVMLASLTPWGFIADVPESFELTPQNAWAENLKKIPDVDIHDDVGSSGMSGMMLRKNNHGAPAHQGFIQDFARINFFSEFKDDSFHFRGEIKEGEDSRVTEVQGSLAIDERMVVKLGSVPKKRLRYLVFWVTCATDHVKKSPEQMDKDREHALEWLGLLDRGDYSKASATAMDDSLFLGLNEVEWSVALTEIRKPRGAVISRGFKTALECGGIVGAQSGKYRLMQFKTEFADGTKAVESITFYKDRDYTWKAVGYFIDPASGAKIPLAERLGGPEIGVLAGIWISGIDAGKYSQSWKDAAGFFQTAITEGAWVSALEGVRNPLGAVKSREIRDLRKVNALPGAPDGEYFVIQFDTSFASKDKAVETVTFMLEKDGTWKAVGYFIR